MKFYMMWAPKYVTVYWWRRKLEYAARRLISIAESDWLVFLS